jgi:hypothetical protein
VDFRTFKNRRHLERAAAPVRNPLAPILMRTIIFFLPTWILLSTCSTRDRVDNQLQNKYPDTISFSRLQIARKWCEVEKHGTEWTYAIPPAWRPVTIELKEIENRTILSLDGGTEGQWYGVNRIVDFGDSIHFESYYPPDSSSVLFSLVYVDKNKSITKWCCERDGYFIPEIDTVNFVRVVQTREKLDGTDSVEGLPVENKTGANSALPASPDRDSIP